MGGSAVTRRPLAHALVAVLAFGAGCARPADEPPPAPVAAAPEAVASPVSEAAVWPRYPPSEALPEDRPLRAGFLIVDGVYNTELVAPFDVLEHVRYRVEPGIEAFTVSADGGPVTTAEGLEIAARYGFDDAPPIDILVVASAEHSRDSDLEDRALIDWVRETGARARYVVSLCWGAFVLAEAGLLDDAAATTFPRDFDAFAERFARVALRRGPTFVHDGKVLTSQGGVRSYDVAMYLVDHLYGPEVARDVGGGLLIDWPYRAAVPEPEIVPPKTGAATPRSR